VTIVAPVASTTHLVQVLGVLTSQVWLPSWHAAHVSAVDVPWTRYRPGPHSHPVPSLFLQCVLTLRTGRLVSTIRHVGSHASHNSVEIL
jgi:hypothetical protein